MFHSLVLTHAYTCTILIMALYCYDLILYSSINYVLYTSYDCDIL